MSPPVMERQSSFRTPSRLNELFFESVTCVAIRSDDCLLEREFPLWTLKGSRQGGRWVKNPRVGLMNSPSQVGRDSRRLSSSCRQTP